MNQTPTPADVDVLVEHTLIVTMDKGRRIVSDGAIAWRDGEIVAVGKTDEVAPGLRAATVIDGRGFVVTPGLVNGHIHVTGEPVTRGHVPDDLGWYDNVFGWLIPLYNVQTEAEERLAAQLAAAEMLRNGVTSFIEAGTIRHLDAVVDGLRQIGIRGRVAQWAQDRAFAPDDDQAALTRQAIKVLQDEVERYPCPPEALIGAWPSLVGHMTATDDLWREASALARSYGGGVTAHMSPAEADPEWYLANTGRRPIEHLAELGVLGPHVSLTHMVHLTPSEVDILAETGTCVNHCPMSALKGGYGATAGLFPEMAAKGVKLLLGTDGANNGNTGDLMRAMFIAAGLFKDARRDTSLFPAQEVLTMATLNGAAGMGLSSRIGALAVGKRADVVLHDIDRPEWRPLMNVVNQLVWSADGRSVHTVFVDGVKVVEAYRCTLVDEQALYAEAEVAGRAIAERAGLPNPGPWPVV
ncbi:MAG: amidohydrolase family protein [Caulobacteraceae bacterium]|nr:amidohydrolase family protein [Caulobacteraceae bacterium]